MYSSYLHMWLSEWKCAYFAQLQVFRNTNLKYSIKYISRRQGGVCLSPLIYSYTIFFSWSTLQRAASWIARRFRQIWSHNKITSVLSQYNYYIFQIFDVLLNGDTIPYPSYFTNVTGSTNYYNILRSTVSAVLLC